MLLPHMTASWLMAEFPRQWEELCAMASNREYWASADMSDPKFLGGQHPMLSKENWRSEACCISLYGDSMQVVTGPPEESVMALGWSPLFSTQDGLLRNKFLIWVFAKSNFAKQERCMWWGSIAFPLPLFLPHFRPLPPRDQQKARSHMAKTASQHLSPTSPNQK